MFMGIHRFNSPKKGWREGNKLAFGLGREPNTGTGSAGRALGFPSLGKLFEQDKLLVWIGRSGSLSLKQGTGLNELIGKHALMLMICHWLEATSLQLRGTETSDSSFLGLIAHSPLWLLGVVSAITGIYTFVFLCLHPLGYVVSEAGTWALHRRH